jgi:tetratricopeptide (TPR) repeat protein
VVLALAALGAGLAGAGVYRRHTLAPDYLLARGRSAIGRGDLEEAWRVVDRLQERGHEAHSLLLRGESWLAISRPAGEGRVTNPTEALQRALQAFAAVQSDGTVGLEAAAHAGECLVRLGKQRAAAEVLNRVVAHDQDMRDAHRWLAAVYIDLSSSNDAIRHLEEWGRLDPEDGRPFRWIGFFQKEYLNPEAAIPAYREALARKLEPGLRADVVRELAETLLDARADYQGVLDTLDTCPEEYRNNPDLRLFRAESYWGMGRRAEGEKLADDVLRSDPNYPRALRVRARMYTATDRPQEARPLLERCVAVAPLDLSARQQLLEVCQRLKDTEAVNLHRQMYEEGRGYGRQLTLLHLALRDRPWDDRVRLEVARLSLRFNRTEEARTMLRAALASNPANQEARRLLDQLRK